MLQVVLAFIVEAFVLKIQAIRKRDCQKHPKDSPGLDGIIVVFPAVMNMQGHGNCVLVDIQIWLCHPSGTRVFSE